ncbi:Crp/Fnr family transcriptional regulator [Loigolactobacillus zhaoyuanensis]|uniref:Crp/Fnr family transcriptional regulator n=1 Tax=Loigolactobacillus zhaoyuanensis TaxID=2486017 RepID=A0ABW8UCD0_9LACO|nr:Crp/Fnr family transcriptional regulator [Loigolactobacillus zhaoyuanensis]
MVAEQKILDGAAFLKKYGSMLTDGLYMEQAPALTTLLYQGDISHSLYFIKQGSLRLWHNNGDKDITMQFFFENQMVSAFESIYLATASLYSIESLENTILYRLDRDNLLKLMDNSEELQHDILNFICERFINYQHYFLSRIKDSPAERYHDLVANEPRIIARVPQHYIASYLGITAVSLSRIKNRH